MVEFSVWTLFWTLFRSEETAYFTSASGVSEFSEAGKLTSAAVLSVVPLEAVMRLSLKGAGSGIDVAVEIPLGEICGQSPIEKDGNLFFLQKVV